jgi:hypothetical protein
MWERKALPVSNWKESNPRRLWRICPKNQQKVTNGDHHQQKDIKNEGLSGKVYENKGSHDKVPEKSRTFVRNLRRFCRKLPDFEG